jgi:hypothetical protein
MVAEMKNNNTSDKLYQAVDVWKRLSETEFVRYRCFKNIATNRYAVQSADFYRLPLDPDQIADLDRQYLELLIEQAPDERSGSFDSIIEAIRAHEAEFADDGPAPSA